jgi:hypothetical protein
MISKDGKQAQGIYNKESRTTLSQTKKNKAQPTEKHHTDDRTLNQGKECPLPKKKNKSGITPFPNGAWASAPRAERHDREQLPATRDAGGSARADRERRTSPEANTREQLHATPAAPQPWRATAHKNGTHVP